LIDAAHTFKPFGELTYLYGDASVRQGLFSETTAPRWIKLAPFLSGDASGQLGDLT
jgi:hypothetical protein